MSLTHFVSLQNEWPEGHRLATVIQFRFPECPKIPFTSIVPRAGQQGQHLITDLLLWDPDKRPNAQQSLRYPYFMNVKNAPSATNRPAIQSSAMTNGGRLSLMEVEGMDTTSLMSRFSVNPKFNNANNDLNEINSMLSVSRLSQNNDKPLVIDTNTQSVQNEVRSSAKAYFKFQSNFNYNVLNDMFNNIKTDTNNNDKDPPEKNQRSIVSPPKKLDEPEKPMEREKINDVFINLLKDPKDSSNELNFNGSFSNSASFFLHEPKNAQQKQRRNDSGTSFLMLSKGNFDGNSFDEGFFDSLNGKRNEKDVVKKWDEGMEDDELASILG